MNFRQLMKQSDQNTCNLEGSIKIKGQPWLKQSFRSLRRRSDKDAMGAHSWTEGHKQVIHSTSKPLMDYGHFNRKAAVLEKTDNETFGFEIQTYGLQVRDRTSVEMCTFICKVQEDSPAQRAGLATGDVIATVNGVCTQGASHQYIVNLIRESTCVLRMETVSGAVFQRIELEKRLRSLKQSLREKWAELQALTLQEQRIAAAKGSQQPSEPSLASPMSLASSCRFSSDSSCWSVLTDEGDDVSRLPCVFEDPCLQGPRDGLAAFDAVALLGSEPGEEPAALGGRRMSSISQASSGGSLSPSSGLWGASVLFGTVSRRYKQDKTRKRISRLIPGLRHSLEEANVS